MPDIFIFSIGGKIKIMSTPPADRKQFPTWPADMDHLCGLIKTIEDIKEGCLVVTHPNSIGSLVHWKLATAWVRHVDPDDYLNAQRDENLASMFT